MRLFIATEESTDPRATDAQLKLRISNAIITLAKKTSDTILRFSGVLTRASHYSQTTTSIPDESNLHSFIFGEYATPQNISNFSSIDDKVAFLGILKQALENKETVAYRILDSTGAKVPVKAEGVALSSNYNEYTAIAEACINHLSKLDAAIDSVGAVLDGPDGNQKDTIVRQLNEVSSTIFGNLSAEDRGGVTRDTLSKKNPGSVSDDMDVEDIGRKKTEETSVFNPERAYVGMLDRDKDVSLLVRGLNRVVGEPLSDDEIKYFLGSIDTWLEESRGTIGDLTDAFITAQDKSSAIIERVAITSTVKRVIALSLEHPEINRDIDELWKLVGMPIEEASKFLSSRYARYASPEGNTSGAGDPELYNQLSVLKKMAYKKSLDIEDLTDTMAQLDESVMDSGVGKPQAESKNSEPSVQELPVTEPRRVAAIKNIIAGMARRYASVISWKMVSGTPTAMVYSGSKSFGLMPGAPVTTAQALKREDFGVLSSGDTAILLNATPSNTHAEKKSSGDFRDRIFTNFASLLSSPDIDIVSPEPSKARPGTIPMSDDSVLGIPVGIDSIALAKIGAGFYRECRNIPEWKGPGAMKPTKAEPTAIMGGLQEYMALCVYHGNVGVVDASPSRTSLPRVSSMYMAGLRILLSSMAKIVKAHTKAEVAGDKEAADIATEAFRKWAVLTDGYVKKMCPWVDSGGHFSRKNLADFKQSNGNVLYSRFRDTIKEYGDGVIRYDPEGVGSKQYTHKTAEIYILLCGYVVELVKLYAEAAGGLSKPGKEAIDNMKIGDRSVIEIYIEAIGDSIQKLLSDKTVEIGRQRARAIQRDVYTAVFGIGKEELVRTLTESIKSNTSALFSTMEQQEGKRRYHVYSKQYRDVIGGMVYDLVDGNGLLGTGAMDIAVSKSDVSKPPAGKEATSILYGRQASGIMESFSALSNEPFSANVSSRSFSKVGRTIVIRVKPTSLPYLSQGTVINILDIDGRVLASADGSTASLTTRPMGGGQVTELRIRSGISLDQIANAASISFEQENDETPDLELTTLHGIYTGGHRNIKQEFESEVKGLEAQVGDIRAKAKTSLLDRQELEGLVSDMNALIRRIQHARARMPMVEMLGSYAEIMGDEAARPLRADINKIDLAITNLWKSTRTLSTKANNILSGRANSGGRV